MDAIILPIFIPTNIILALAVLFNNPKSATNKLFALLIFILTIYLTINTQLAIFPDHATKLFISRTIIALGAAINLFVFLFLFTFPHPKITLKPLWFWMLNILTVFLFIVGFTPLIFADITVKNNVVAPIPGMLMPVFLLHTVFLIFGGIVAIFLRYRKTVGIDKNRIRYVFFAFAILFSLITVLNFLFPVFLKVGNFVPFLPLYILVFNGIVAYAIVRHRLLDIRVLVARTVAFSLLILFLGGIYSLTFFFVGSAILSIPFTTQQLVFYALFAFVVAVCFHPLQRFVEKGTDKLFYRNNYDSDKLLKLFSHIMSVTLELDELANKILQEVIEKMKVTRAAFIILSQKQERIEFVFQKGYTDPPSYSVKDVSLFINHVTILNSDDLEEGELKETMKKQGISVVLPLIVSENKIGVFCLGEKATGDIYSQQDTNIFEILAPELSVAIRNAQDYEEIKRFNITLQKEVNDATKELKDANEKLKALDKLKDEFVSLASHELRTPMTAIKSYLWMALAGKGGQLNEKQKYYLDRAYTSTDRLIKLVNEMLNVSRIESGRINLERKSVDLNKIGDDIVADVTARAAELGIHVSIDHASDLPFVFADENKVKEVLINLVGNSLKFTPKDGTVTLSFSQRDDMIEVQVKDSGKGIALEDVPKLFQKFGKIDNSYLTIQNVQGTGLGLYISKAIVQLHGGKIWVNSEGIGKGTTFTFSLPIVHESSLQTASEKLQN